jgi:hypothetical protein
MVAARREHVPRLRAASAAFEGRLAAELGEDRSAAQEALLTSASACYSALWNVSQRLRATYRLGKLTALAEQVVPLCGALQRSLRLLGVIGRDSGAEDAPDAPSKGGIADYLAGRDPDKSEAPDA